MVENGKNKFQVILRCCIGRKKKVLEKALLQDTCIYYSEFKLGNQPLLVTDSYVYLGITFMPSSSFSLTQKKLYNKATRSLCRFLSEVNIYNGASVSTILKLFLFSCEPNPLICTTRYAKWPYGFTLKQVTLL